MYMVLYGQSVAPRSTAAIFLRDGTALRSHCSDYRNDIAINRTRGQRGVEGRMAQINVSAGRRADKYANNTKLQKSKPIRHSDTVAMAGQVLYQGITFLIQISSGNHQQFGSIFFSPLTLKRAETKKLHLTQVKYLRHTVHLGE